jgi:hypothetical protein
MIRQYSAETTFGFWHRTSLIGAFRTMIWFPRISSCFIKTEVRLIQSNNLLFFFLWFEHNCDCPLNRTDRWGIIWDVLILSIILCAFWMFSHSCLLTIHSSHFDEIRISLSFVRENPALPIGIFSNSRKTDLRNPCKRSWAKGNNPGIINLYDEYIINTILGLCFIGIFIVTRERIQTLSARCEHFQDFQSLKHFEIIQ